MTGSRVTQTPDGRWSVAIDVEAAKFYADASGVQTEAPLDEPLEVGVFTAEPGAMGFSATSVLYLERQPVRSGRQTLTVLTNREPRFVGIDPYNKYVDRNSNDNVRPAGRH